MKPKDRSISDVISELQKEILSTNIPVNAVSATQMSETLGIPRGKLIHQLDKLCANPKSGWHRAKPWAGRSYLYWKK